MEMIAKGKWSKQFKSWTKVVALRRPAAAGDIRRPPTVKRKERPQGR
jgi:hypothetical protein